METFSVTVLKKPSEVEIRVSILFYSGKSNKADKIFQIITEEQASREPIEVISTTEDLSTRLRRSRYDLSLIILLISSQKELEDLILLRDLVSDMPIILILPDRNRDTIHKGHKLYPRFLSYMDSDFIDVALVLNKMLRNAYAKERKMRGILQPEVQQAQTVPHPN